jgi:malonyl-CoA/methylmalonyl-CoA synthetase
VAEEVSQLGQDIRQHVSATSAAKLPIISILPNLPKTPQYTAFDIVISSTHRLLDTAPGVVIFTSGTTGRPKGAVMRRSYTHEAALAIGEGYDVTHTDVVLHTLPVHHTTGLQTSFFVFLVAGACIEFKRGSFDPKWTWNRWAQGGLNVFSTVPTVLLRLKWHYEKNIATLPPEERQLYDDAVNRFREIMCGSAALQEPVQDFWTALRRGRPILTRYGATEFPGCLKVPTNAPRDLPKGCVGMPVPGVEVKLSEGDEGELLVRSPYMFSKYLFDSAATRAAHDCQGFFKTGDILRREGNYFFVVGRESVDIVKSGGYKISATDVEKACLKLAYVNEAAVVGVEDEEFGQRVGVILGIASSIDERNVTIQRLRRDLREGLAAYKLPTIMRVVRGELPKGGTGKIQKKMLGPQMFPREWRTMEKVHFWDSKAGSKL